MSTPRPPYVDRPGSAPAPQPPLLRRNWPVAAAAAAAAALLVTPSVLSRVDSSVPVGERDLTPACGSLSRAQPGLRMPAGLPALPGQFVYQIGSYEGTEFTFTAVPALDVGAAVRQATAALAGAGYRVSAPPATAPAGADRPGQPTVLTVAGPGGRGTITISGRCAGQAGVAYAFTPP